jgi:4-oxalmesaconate hydratase
MTGRNFEDLVPIFQEIDWLTREERYKITEGNVRKLFPRIFGASPGR